MKRYISARIKENIHDELKKKLLVDRISVQSWIEKMIEEYLKK